MAPTRPTSCASCAKSQCGSTSPSPDSQMARRDERAYQRRNLLQTNGAPASSTGRCSNANAPQQRRRRWPRHSLSQRMVECNRATQEDAKHHHHPSQTGVTMKRSAHGKAAKANRTITLTSEEIATIRESLSRPLGKVQLGEIFFLVGILRRVTDTKAPSAH